MEGLGWPAKIRTHPGTNAFGTPQRPRLLHLAIGKPHGGYNLRDLAAAIVKIAVTVCWDERCLKP
jgi:hypothetical protein